MGSRCDPEYLLVLKILVSNLSNARMFLQHLNQKLEIFLVQQCPKSVNKIMNICFVDAIILKYMTCNVTILSSISTSLVKKSAPIVALYCAVHFLFTYVLIY